MHPEELEKEGVYSLDDSLCMSYLSLQQVFSATIKMLSQQLSIRIPLLRIFFYLMELVKLQHKLSELLWEAQGNPIFATSKYFLQCFVESFWPMRETNKKI